MDACQETLNFLVDFKKGSDLKTFNQIFGKRKGLLLWRHFISKNQDVIAWYTTLLKKDKETFTDHVGDLCYIIAIEEGRAEA